jgi:predicted ATPase/DNA-binding CsgD family transcriptional regulator
MTRSRLPLVSDNHVLGLDGAGEQIAPVIVGSDAWYTWLADRQIQSFSFRNLLGSFTARRERKRHGWYWYAYRKRAGRLRKAYLGKTEELTPQRLNAVAAALSGQGNDDAGPLADPEALDRSTPPVISDTIEGDGRFFLAPISIYTSPTEAGQVTTHNLPAQLTSLIGREQEVAAACTLLRQSEVRLLTLTGTGGVGKTRLGLQVATELLGDFADGVCFVSLAPLSDPELVLPTITHALGLREGGDQAFIERLSAFLQEKCQLLLLDNFEQVIGAAAALMELLERCPALKILVTSREVLRVRGEQEFHVLPLALPNLSYLPEPAALSQYAAVAFFLQRVRSVKPDFQITTTNARTIAAICTHLDGIPLALELAATHLKILSPTALLARLEHRLQVLTQGHRDVHTRQQTLRNTLQWSYDLLDAEEQRLFRRLAVFAGGCTLEAAEVVCKAADDEMMNVFDGVVSLLDKSLVQQQSAQKDGEPRLVMLETIREYGLECLTTSGELEVTRQSHALYYLTLAEEAAPNLFGTEPAMWSERLEREHNNLRAALHWSLEQEEAGHSMELALQLGVALMGFWILYGHLGEGRTFLERALAASQGVMASIRAKAIVAAAFLAINQGDLDWTKTLSEEGLALSRELGDPDGIASNLTQLGFVAHMQCDLDTAISLGEEVVSLAREKGDKNGIFDALQNLAFVRLERGEYARACAMYEECLVVFRELGNKVAIASTLHQLALVLFLSLGDQERVRSLLEESLALWQEMGSKNGIAVWSYLAGQVALHQGDASQAHSLLEESVAHYKEVGDRSHTARSLSALAKVEAMQGNYAAARTFYEENLTLCREMGNKNIAPALEGLASVAMGQEQPACAARLWGMAEALRETIGAPIWPVERAAYEHSVAAARALLGERKFGAAWVEGRMTPSEQALVAQGPATMPTLILAGGSSTPPAKPSVTSPAELTRREMEVLRLLTMGLTNIQIAEQLVISLATVNTHVGSIYAKLGVTSRSAATRYAVEHHLV